MELTTAIQLIVDEFRETGSHWSALKVCRTVRSDIQLDKLDTYFIHETNTPLYLAYRTLLTSPDYVQAAHEVDRWARDAFEHILERLSIDNPRLEIDVRGNVWLYGRQRNPYRGFSLRDGSRVF